VLDGLRIGLLLTVVVIFLLLAANFNRLARPRGGVDRAAVIAAWHRPLDHGTTLTSVFHGAIMAIGVATANAILLITSPRGAPKPGSRCPGRRPGVRDRLRPILMTSAAMIAGMIPMAIGLERGASRRPLRPGRHRRPGRRHARDLTIRPSVFSVLQSGRPTGSGSWKPERRGKAAANETMNWGALAIMKAVAKARTGASV